MERLIPAWAGKTRTSGARSTKRAAHPRVGGENTALPDRPPVGRGSSPRRRGKRVRARMTPRCAGLIPA